MAAQELTPAQTVGPFFGFALPFAGGPDVVPGGDVRLFGTVYDGAGEAVPDAMVELLQADEDGDFDDPVFGRSSTRLTGEFEFTTVKPGPTADGCAPHLALIVHARGLLLHLQTRVYFPDETEANAADPVLAAVPAERRHTLIARADNGGLRFDIRLQGPEETVFFDV